MPNVSLRGSLTLADTALQTVRHEIAQVNGADAHYTRAGRDGSPLVLVHGGAGNRHDWAKNIKALSEAHQVYAPDLLGFGQNFRDDTPHTVRRFSDFLGDFMDAVGLRSASLVGHSLGARVCLDLAQREPHRTDRLVLAAPIGFGRLSVPGYILGTMGWALSKLARRRLPYPPLDIELNERSHEHLRTVTASSLNCLGKVGLFLSPPLCPSCRRNDSQLQPIRVSPVGARPAQERAIGLQRCRPDLPVESRGECPAVASAGGSGLAKVGRLLYLLTTLNSDMPN